MRVLIPGQQVRATVPAIEAVIRAGNRVTRGGIEIVEATAARAAAILPDPWTVWLTRPPPSVVRVDIEERAEIGYRLVPAIRLRLDPPYPQESEHGDGWARAEWVACPGPPGHPCGSVLLWAEANYVPGWRFCLRGHFASLDRLARVGEAEITYKGRIPDTSQYPRRPIVAYEEGP